ncbi:c-type cytochrome [Paraflavitalea pollutisoli]|uniref:c-type cytochrome n=1 Tax=Paraflavitalea pollutisoli TaxID=3034143 RepID=UPI0023EAF8B3|nr:cytochrome c [Paraflavitalea sp. H1-2-19X]
MNNQGLFYFLLCVWLIAMTSCGSSPVGTAAPGKLATASTPDTSNWPSSFAFGHTASASYIDSIDIDIAPDGKGLPAGSGTATEGQTVYAVKCAACHGKTGAEGPFQKLVGAMGDTTKAKTIGNYWPYATTLYDYIRRAMPFNEPGSLTNAEVYQLTAYLLHANQIIDATTVIDAGSLPQVQMPARALFVNDDRKGGPEIR